MQQGFVGIPTPFLAQFQLDKTGLLTVGYTLVNTDGTEYAARSTANVVELGNGDYGTTITFGIVWRGYIKWDTGELVPTYAQEEVSIFAVPLAAADYVAPDNAGIAAIPTNPLLDDDPRIDNLDAPISEVPTGVWNFDTTGIIDPGLAGTRLNSSEFFVDPWAKMLPGGYEFGTAGQILARLQVDETTDPVIAILAPKVPGMQTLIIIAEQLGGSWAVGDSVRIVPYDDQVFDDKILSTKALTGSIGVEGIAGITDPEGEFTPGMPVDKGAKIRVHVSNTEEEYFARTITVDDSEEKNILDYTSWT